MTVESFEQALRAITRARKAIAAAEEYLSKGAKPKAPQKPKQGPVWARIEGLNMDAWMRWLEFRRQIGKVYKTEAVARWLVRETSGNHAQQDAIISQSIDKEWQGLFPVKGYGLKADQEPERGML